jgi:bifunctional N-acetylglucosamine-1-phosphate-uridyltransferase/glucosamine-1-phosphate-acetyltransferase GlmU-like protein
MAGEGKRFAEVGYTIVKPAIPTIDWRTGMELPMVICSTKDLPGMHKDGSNVIYVDRHGPERNIVEEQILSYLPKARFITLDEVTKGQACTCLMAKDLINNNDELFISSCDYGMVYSLDEFETAKKNADALILTFRKNRTILNNPDAYGWMKTDVKGNIIGLSIKKAISDTPMEDHAVVGSFWFKEGKIFVEAAEEMISKNDRINKEFYVDLVPKYLLEKSYNVKVFQIDRYLNWGTPEDYENYIATYKYWQNFMKGNKYLGD